MKRVKVSPGKFVAVPTAIVEKAARVFTTGAFTSAQMLDMAAAESKIVNGMLLGGTGAGKRKAAQTPSRK